MTANKPKSDSKSPDKRVGHPPDAQVSDPQAADPQAADPQAADPQAPDPQLPDPLTVLKDPSLSREAKIKKLQRWSYDARELDVANEEGMGGDARPSNLDEVREALRELGADDEETPHKQ